MTDAAPVSFPLRLLAPPDPATLPLPHPAHPAHPADGARLLRGAVYAVPDGSRLLTVDLWLPEEAAPPVPVVVFVHGGAWRTGLRDDLGPRFRSWQPGPFARLARAGFAVACPDYRLSGEVPYPAQTDDLTASLAWGSTPAPTTSARTPHGPCCGANRPAATSPP
ncbi:putative esterase [Streptomyces hygroscopicus subsp. jinggangensis 5008]|nr:putative esterase [Streptomyces hygroscopicus subsp. jinggangensis 5008]